MFPSQNMRLTNLIGELIKGSPKTIFFTTSNFKLLKFNYPKHEGHDQFLSLIIRPKHGKFSQLIFNGNKRF